MADSEETIGHHWPSHEGLIQMVAPTRRPIAMDVRLDAIIVPASRPVENLMTAIDLAVAADCHLVVLCSMQARPERVRSRFAAKNFAKGTAIKVPGGYDYPPLRLETSEWVKGDRGKNVCGGRHSDLSMKRNIGLLIARMLGWRQVFFMDDDIRGISVNDLTRTASLLGTDGKGYRSAGLHVECLHPGDSQEENFQASITQMNYSSALGAQGEHFQFSSTEVKLFRSSSMQVKHFPDNSVICHARRMVGMDQDVFVSGSVLAVDATAPFDFFPDIYNEDWLFFYRDVAARKLASPGLHATQMEQIKYNPFADPQRAAREEFGDVIAEGLYSLLHHDLDLRSATYKYWETFLINRNAVLDTVLDLLPKAPPELRGGIDKAILTARETLKEITPGICVDYLSAWQRDLERWEKLLANLTPTASVEGALSTLGLS